MGGERNFTMSITPRSVLVHCAALGISAAFFLASHTAVAIPRDDDDAMQKGTPPQETAPPPKAPDGGQGGGQGGDGGILKGPRVPPGAAEGKGGFGEGGKGARGGARGGQGGMGGPAGEARAFFGALKTVEPPLSDDQRSKIESLRAGYEQEMKAWKEKNGARLQEIEQAMRAGRAQRGEDGKGTPGEGGAPPAKGDAKGKGTGDQPNAPDRRKVMEDMQALRATMPKFDGVRDQVMGVLNPQQQDALKQAMQKMRESGGGKDGPGRPGGRKGGPGGDDGAPPKAPPPQDPPKGDYKFKE